MNIWDIHSDNVFTNYICRAEYRRQSFFVCSDNFCYRVYLKNVSPLQLFWCLVISCGLGTCVHDNMALFTPGITKHTWTPLNTSVNDLRDALWSDHSNQLGCIWQQIFCRVNTNASWRVSDQDVTGKYVINAGRGGCFGKRLKEWRGAQVYVIGIIWTVRIACTCILVFETFLLALSSSACAKNKSGACLNDVITAWGRLTSLWKSCGQQWTLVISGQLENWDHLRRVIETGIDLNLSRLSSCDWLSQEYGHQV